MPKYLRIVFDLLKQTFKDWQSDHAPRLAAALAYYTAFSLAPLLVIAIAIAGLVLGQAEVQAQVVGLVRTNAGADAGSLVSGLIDSASQPREGLIATVLGVITLVFGAIGALSQLQNALDVIWDVEDQPRPGGVMGWLRTNLLNFGMVIFVGFLLLVSLVLNTLLASLGEAMGTFITIAPILQVVNLLVSFGVVTFLFALIYKVLPHTKVTWRDVWIGAAFTALLFSIGRYALSLYLAYSGTASAFGAAGSFAVILLWVYYSAQILLFGAEFTQVFSARYGTRSTAPGAKASAAVFSTGTIPRERAIVPVLTPDRSGPRMGFLSAMILTVGMLGTTLLAGRFVSKDSR